METGESETRREGTKVCIDEQVTGYSNWAHSRPSERQGGVHPQSRPREGREGRAVCLLAPALAGRERILDVLMLQHLDLPTDQGNSCSQKISPVQDAGTWREAICVHRNCLQAAGAGPDVPRGQDTRSVCYTPQPETLLRPGKETQTLTHPIYSIKIH